MTTSEKKAFKKKYREEFNELYNKLTEELEVDLELSNVKIEGQGWFRKRQRLAYRFFDKNNQPLTFTKKVKAISEICEAAIAEETDLKLEVRKEQIHQAIRTRETTFVPQTDWQFMMEIKNT